MHDQTYDEKISLLNDLLVKALVPLLVSGVSMFCANQGGVKIASYIPANLIAGWILYLLFAGASLFFLAWGLVLMHLYYEKVLEISQITSIIFGLIITAVSLTTPMISFVLLSSMQ